MEIIGAGLSGLIAAHIWPRAQLYELAEAPAAAHQALLRFRSDAVANVTGIPFRRVTVRKGIWHNGEFRAPNIQLANAYSLKCLGVILPERSIWNLDPVERYIAPENFYAQLVESVHNRITWGCDYFSAAPPKQQEPRISTAALPFTLKAFGALPADLAFARMPITVQRFRVPGCEVYQTVYFPTAKHSVYRASITGSLLIVEHARSPDTENLCGPDICGAFDIDGDQTEQLSEVKQTFGKINPIDDGLRKALLFHLTREHNVFSLGRFACWRNTLLDDVVADAAVIKRLIVANSHYEGFKEQ